MLRILLPFLLLLTLVMLSLLSGTTKLPSLLSSLHWVCRNCCFFCPFCCGWKVYCRFFCCQYCCYRSRLFSHSFLLPFMLWRSLLLLLLLSRSLSLQGMLYVHLLLSMSTCCSWFWLSLPVVMSIFGRTICLWPLVGWLVAISSIAVYSVAEFHFSPRRWGKCTGHCNPLI